jgi:hypothetical protein
LTRTGGRVGELEDKDTAWFSELKGIKVGTEDKLLPRKRVASDYAEFVAKHAPWEVTARSLTGAINKKFATPKTEAQKNAANTGREVGDVVAGAAAVAEMINSIDPLETVTKAQAAIGPLRKRISKAKEANDVAELEAAETDLQIAQGKIFVNQILEQFCPYYADTARGREDTERVRKGERPRTDIIRAGDFRGYSETPDELDRQMYRKVGEKFPYSAPKGKKS